MANFTPFKTYILAMLDDMAHRHQLSGPFLDIGCGRGDVAIHLAQAGWQGKAIDISPDAFAIARTVLAAYPEVEVVQASLETQHNQRFNTLLMFDVLEHIVDDKAALAHAAQLQTPGAALILTLPSNPNSEWRWDDAYYGHLRRYQPLELERLLLECGYGLAEMWDISFPFFWLLRRGFTVVKRSPTMAGSPRKRTEGSAIANAWEMGWLSEILSIVWLWRPALAIQAQFRRRPERGCEIMVLARRR